MKKYKPRKVYLDQESTTQSLVKWHPTNRWSLVFICMRLIYLSRKFQTFQFQLGTDIKT